MRRSSLKSESLGQSRGCPRVSPPTGKGGAVILLLMFVTRCGRFFRPTDALGARRVSNEETDSAHTLTKEDRLNDRADAGDSEGGVREEAET